MKVDQFWFPAGCGRARRTPALGPRARVFLDRGLCDGDPEFDEFAANSFDTPQAVLSRHLLDQGYGFTRKPGGAAPVAGLELPEQAEALAMPTQECIGLQNEESLLPSTNATCQENEPEAIRLGEPWFLGLAIEDDELLAEEGILRDEFGPRAREIKRSAKNRRTAGGAGEVEETMLQGVDHGVDEVHYGLGKGGHGDRSPERLSEFIRGVYSKSIHAEFASG